MKKQISEGHCFRCGQQGHLKKDCPAKSKSVKVNKRACQITVQLNQKEEVGDASSPPPNYENQLNLTVEEHEQIVDKMMGMPEDF